MRKVVHMRLGVKQKADGRRGQGMGCQRYQPTGRLEKKSRKKRFVDGRMPEYV